MMRVRTSRLALFVAVFAAFGRTPAHAQPAARTDWWRDATCYEVFVRSFQDSNGDGIGDLRGLISRLDYINDGNRKTTRDLGADCIWLMPVFDSPSYHGYDVTNYEHINPQYGTLGDFKELLTQAHRRGIRVIVDFVANHTSTAHPWFVDAARGPESAHRNWYLWTKNDTTRFPSPWGGRMWHYAPDSTWRYLGFFWSGMPDLNLVNPAVESELQRVARYWLNDVGVDGFRLDAVRHFVETDQKVVDSDSTHRWLERFAAFVRAQKPSAYLVGEAWIGLDVLPTYYPRQLHEYFNFALADSIIASVRSGKASSFLNALRASDALLPEKRWATFLTNHDQTRIATTLRSSPRALRAAACALLLSPGTPFIYYGEEIGMHGDKPDEQLRTPMQWGLGARRFTTRTAWERSQPDSAVVTVEAQDRDSTSLLSYYRMLTQLRTRHAALRRGTFILRPAHDPRLAEFDRRLARDRVVVRINFSGDTVPVPGSRPLAPYSCRVESEGRSR